MPTHGNNVCFRGRAEVVGTRPTGDDSPELCGIAGYLGGHQREGVIHASVSSPAASLYPAEQPAATEGAAIGCAAFVGASPAGSCRTTALAMMAQTVSGEPIGTFQFAAGQLMPIELQPAPRTRP